MDRIGKLLNERADHAGSRSKGKAAKRRGRYRLAERNFERRFQLADSVLVTDARPGDGLLCVSPKREPPEAPKPRRIAISTAAMQAAAPQIEGEAKAA